MGVIIWPLTNAERFKMYFLSFSLLVSIIRVSNSLSCLPCCEDNNPVQVAADQEDVALAVSVLGGAEPPSYEECHFCPPPPEYCSKGHHTVLDERGCCQVCPKLEHEECGGPCGVDGTCADYLQCVREDLEDKHSRGTCQHTVAKDSTSYCTEACAYREKGVAHSPVYCLGNKWDSHRYEFETLREPVRTVVH